MKLSLRSVVRKVWTTGDRGARALRFVVGAGKVARFLWGLAVVASLGVLYAVAGCSAAQQSSELRILATVGQDEVTGGELACALAGHVPFLDPAQEAEADFILIATCGIAQGAGAATLAFVHGVEKLKAGSAAAKAATVDVFDAREVVAAMMSDAWWRPSDAGEAGL